MHSDRGTSYRMYSGTGLRNTGAKTPAEETCNKQSLHSNSILERTQMEQTKFVKELSYQPVTSLLSQIVNECLESLRGRQHTFQLVFLQSWLVLHSIGHIYAPFPTESRLSFCLTVFYTVAGSKYISLLTEKYNTSKMWIINIYINTHIHTRCVT